MIDRRDEQAIALLVRLAFAEGLDNEPSASTGSGPEGCPPPDAEPLIVEGIAVPFIWRSARVAALEAASSAPGLADALAAKGIEVFSVPASGSARSEVIARLATALAEAST